MSNVQLYKQAMEMIPASLLTSFKATVTFLILFNIQSFPLVWHWNVMAKYFAWLARSRFLGVIDEPVALKFPDARDAYMKRSYRAWPTNCDAFGFHLSNSTYSAYADHVRGPHLYSLLSVFFDLPTSTFALGSTTFDFKREIPFMAKYDLTIQLMGYDKKWLYLIAKYTSKDKKGAVQTHCLHLSHVVLKINGRRTVQPARAFALCGYGPDSKHNFAVVDKMTKAERRQWVIGDGPERDISVGPVEFGLEKQAEWPGQLALQQS